MNDTTVVSAESLRRGGAGNPHLRALLARVETAAASIIAVVTVNGPTPAALVSAIAAVEDCTAEVLTFGPPRNSGNLDSGEMLAAVLAVTRLFRLLGEMNLRHEPYRACEEISADQIRELVESGLALLSLVAVVPDASSADGHSLRWFSVQ